MLVEKKRKLKFTLIKDKKSKLIKIIISPRGTQ